MESVRFCRCLAEHLQCFLNSSVHHRTVVFWDILLKPSEENLPTAKNDLSWRAAALSTGPASCPVFSVPFGCTVHYGSHQCVEKNHVCSCGDTGSSDRLPVERDEKKLLRSFQDRER
ncbi:beta-galactoside alpha-2,6-sialyltransferase 1 [Grus japonensis]|uniref:Beta-galactoside alpha-2,6-sialyltransferase 1 n=1 Tax=Grus japonensis TaxID=30415 RepID=A0ABC9X6Y9_GRUJA